MATPSEKNFEDYKRAEAKALQLLAEMKTVAGLVGKLVFGSDYKPNLAAIIVRHGRLW